MDINQSLIEAGTKYRKELLTLPVVVLEEVLQYMSIRTGIQGKEVGGVLTVDAELRPYKTAKGASDGTAIEPFEWETFLGDVVKEFDPNAILGTLYTEKTDKTPTEREIAKKVAFEMAKKVGEALYNAMFVAVRDVNGSTTMALFNGYSTLAAAAVTANKLTVAKKNYQDITTTVMTTLNVGDLLKAAYRNIHPLLKKKKVNMYLPSSVLDMYEDWFQVEHGHAPWNDRFEQMTLVGSRGKCQFIPLDNMEGQDFIFISTADNMLVGVDQMSDKEKVRIRECDNPKLVQFFMMAYFGVGFDNLDARFINVIKFTTEEEEPEEGGGA